ncbi:MAG: hypothetical protein ACLSCV_07670 [Acutalibacteraceae bacterium]
MKKLAIIGSITCVVGVIIFISAFASIGWDITKFPHVRNMKRDIFQPKIQIKPLH